VLILVRHPDGDLDNRGVALALIAISDRIRPAAKETIANFQEQGVTLKVISGDHAETVSTIAGKVGINNADKYISCENLTDEELVEAAENYAVFGRVTPEQKVLLIKTLKVNGHTVAMTGDGVNDTLALKESNCAIAMADGSEMARKVSHIVLMNSDFSSLPDVVKEGRRCINNVRQSSVLYLMKTIFTIVLSLISAIMTVVTVGHTGGYPFEPKQFLLLELFIIGISSVLLAIEPNNKRIEGKYLETVIIRSFPNALAMLGPVLAVMFSEGFVSMSESARNSIAMSALLVASFINLVALCRPFSKWRATVVLIIGALLGTAIPVSIFVLDDMLHFKPIAENPYIFMILIGATVVFTLIMQYFRGRIEKVIERNLEKNRDRVIGGFRKKDKS